MKAVFRKSGVLLAAATLLIAGCGGGGGSDSGGTNPPPPPPTGGITRTGDAVAVGPITGFGSVIVNGVRYDTSSATFTREGQTSSQASFKIGETVLVKGRIDDNNANATATEVEFEDAVEGPVSGVDDVLRTFAVLGQTVQIVAGTVIDDNCSGGLAGLMSYPQVEVSGTTDDNGVVEATRIECKSTVGADDLFEVNGIVENLNPGGAMTFEVNGQVVDYSSAVLADFPGGAITAGDPVEAKGDSLGGAGQLLASRVEYKGARFADDAGDHIEIEGFITRYVSPSNFDVSGVPVKEITGTRYEGGSSADLGLNLKVEVEGEFDAQGVLNATKIQIKRSTEVRVTALVDSVSGSTLQLLGITVNTDEVKTRFDDQSTAGLDPLLVSNLARGDYVEIRGQELPEGQITAMEVRRNDERDRSELRGFVEVGGRDATNRTLTVLGVTIRTSGTTVYKNAADAVIDEATFWATVAEGTLVKGRQDNQAATLDLAELNATELQLEAE